MRTVGRTEELIVCKKENTFIAWGVVTASLFTVTMLANEDAPDRELTKDQIILQRQQLIAEARRLSGSNDISDALRLAKIRMKICVLDASDPTSPVGAAVLMKGVSNEELAEVACQYVLGRRPNDRELKRVRMSRDVLPRNRLKAMEDLIFAFGTCTAAVERVRTRKLPLDPRMRK